MVSEPREKKNPNYFQFIHESILGNLSVTVFHSDHPSHLLKLFDQPYRRQKTLTVGNFSGEVLFWHRPYHQVRKEEIFKFSQSTGGRLSATRFHLQPRLTPSSHPPSVLVSSEPWKCIFWGFVSVDPLNSLSDDLRWLPLHPEPCTCLRKCSSTLLVVPHLFFFTIWSLTVAVNPRFFLF